MLNQVMKNSALCAKVHAMRGRFLKKSDYDAMMNMKSVPDVAGYLIEHTRYSRALKGTSAAQIHRGALEQFLREDLKTDINSLMPYMSYGAKKFAELTEIEEGISILKICLRLLGGGHSREVPEYLEKLKATGTVDKMGSVDGIESIDMLVDRLAETPYYAALKVFSSNPDKQKPFYMEMWLDTYWTKLVFKYLNKYLTGSEKSSIRKLYGTEFDLENLTFLLRCKKSFDMTDEEIYTCLIPLYYRLKEETVTHIVDAQSYDDALEIIESETPYGAAFSKEDRFIEKREREFILHLFARAYSTNQYSVLSPVDYLYRRRAEIDNIISVTEGIRYGLSPERIKDYLINTDLTKSGKGGTDV